MKAKSESECEIIYLHIFLAHGYLGSFIFGAAMNLAAVNITFMGLSWHTWVYVNMRVPCFSTWTWVAGECMNS